MYRPFLIGGSALPRAVRSPRTAIIAVAAVVATLGIAAPAATARPAGPGDAPAAAQQLQAQVLTWTASDDFTAYRSAPTTAVAGPATIVFENSVATGNTSGMQHTLTFDTSDPAYNRDVNVDIVADPYDANNGRHQVDVVLTPGKYRFFCAFPGHGSMTGVLVVTDGGGDTTAPTVTAAVSGEKDANGAYVGAATVTLTATDSGSGVARTEYALDGGPYGTYSGPVTVNQPGNHTVTYRATDKAGNTSTPQSVSFTVVAVPPKDTTPPTVTAAVSGEKDANGAYVGSATVTLSATDTESGVDRIEYSVDGQAYATYGAPVTVNQVGNHTVSYRATDKAGNTSTPQSVSFTVVAVPPKDTTPPAVTAAVSGEKDANGAYVGSATVTLSATDGESGVDRVEFSLDGAPYSAYSAPVTVNQPGNHTVTYRATDKAGNTSTPQSVSFTVVAVPPKDTTPPAVTAAVSGNRDANGAYVGAATVTLTATDAESGVEKVEYALDGGAYAAYTAPVTVNQAGSHTLSYRATDQAGNTSEVKSVSFTVVPTDSTAPTVTAAVAGDRDANGAYVGAATVTLTATDSGSGVEKVEYALDGGGYATYSAPVTVVQPGNHTVSYRATDRAGNTSEVKSVSFTVVAKDTTAPTVTAAVSGDRDANGAYVGAATVTLTATDTESGVAKVEYALDGGGYATYSGPVTVNQVGSHTVSYRATDNAGNTSAAQSVSFTVVAVPPKDTTAPTVTAAVSGEKDANGAYVGAATVTLTATDSESGVDRVEFSLDGQPYAGYSAPVTVNQPGNHTVTYRATDRAGNTSTPKSVSFTVVEPPAKDTTPPTVSASVSGNLDGSGAYVGSATVTLTASDAESGIERVEYSVDGAPYATYTGPVTVNRPGDHTLSYRATDKAGNTSGTGSVTFRVAESGTGPDCPVPDTRPTVVLGTVDSGVRNRAVAGPCTINNLIEDEREWRNHGQFVKHVEMVAGHLHHAELIDNKEHSAIVNAAARSGVGKPDDKSYTTIFDGSAESFARWEHVGGGGFTLNKDGSITSKAQPGLGMLWFPVKAYGDFSLKLQWRDDAPGTGRANSGVFVRFPEVHSHPTEKRPEWVAIKYGHEVQILDRTDGDQYKTGSIYGFDRVDLAGAHATPKGTWNDYEIRVVGQHYSVFRNGVLINEYVNAPGAVFSPPRADDPGTSGRQNATGFIGLQNHGTGDLISFRNIRIAELSPACPDGTTASGASCHCC